MKKNISIPALRIKVTGICNRSCIFCHEEGGMSDILCLKPSIDFKLSITEILKLCNIKRIMFTGGEPFMNKHLKDLVSISNSIPQCETISITTNGIRLIEISEWIELKEKGLEKVIFSIHDASPEDFLKLETKRGLTKRWAEKACQNQFINIENALKAGLKVRTNTVACTTYEKLKTLILKLTKIQSKFRNLDIRILNELNGIVHSQYLISHLLDSLNASLVGVIKRSGSSSVARFYRTPEEYQISVKFSYLYYLNMICSSCSLRGNSCTEGYYGIRFEERAGGYYIRLCIYRNDEQVLIPWEKFIINSNLIRKINNLKE